VNKYIIQPNGNVRVAITNFSLRHDVTDVSRFSQLKNITDIMYVIYPFLTIILVLYLRWKALFTAVNPRESIE
jgi:hypothetical protein